MSWKSSDSDGSRRFERNDDVKVTNARLFVFATRRSRVDPSRIDRTMPIYAIERVKYEFCRVRSSGPERALVKVSLVDTDDVVGWTLRHVATTCTPCWTSLTTRAYRREKNLRARVARRFATFSLSREIGRDNSFTTDSDIVETRSSERTEREREN